jgi:hypothetical protein
MEEVWEDIPNFKGYQASNLGDIRSISFRRTKKIKNLSKFSSKNGYLRVKITINGMGKSYSVHRLVAATFLGESKELEINHKDGDKTNNKIENLEYCTRSENMLHAYRNGLKVAPSGKNHNKAKGVCQIKNNKIIRYYDYMSEVDNYGFSHSKVCLCCQGKRNKHKGYMWKYIGDEV